jgi:phytoene dehydrogenase-like protein
MKYDVLIVGGGIAGLTAAAFLTKSGKSVALFEKQAKTGGLVQTFQRNGVYFDTGLRSIENTGVVFPMLQQLGIDVGFRKSVVSIGIADQVMRVEDQRSLVAYEDLLKKQFPESKDDIAAIISVIKKIMGYMDVLYGIDNPALIDFSNNKKYLFKVMLPWLFRFLFTMRRINKLNEPVEDYLKKMTDNQALIDIIAQHFFKKTPTSFALSYFSLYLDYYYPKGGTGAVTQSLTDFITNNGGIVNTGLAIKSLNPEQKFVVDDNGNRFTYNYLIWACDLKQLYNIIPLDDLENKGLIQKISQKRNELKTLTGGDSVFTLYLTLRERKEFFENICTGHFFYTPSNRGLSAVSNIGLDGFLNAGEMQSDNAMLKEKLKAYLLEYFKMNTFEIAIPVLRDSDLAPEGTVGLEVSLFLDYQLCEKIEAHGWTNEMHDFMEQITIDILNEHIFPGIVHKVTDRFSSSPLTIERITANTHGAITGWAFTNPEIPVVNQMLQVNKAVKTCLPSIFQAGQWTYSPSGFPMAIVTGKIAADKVLSMKQ